MPMMDMTLLFVSYPHRILVTAVVLFIIVISTFFVVVFLILDAWSEVNLVQPHSDLASFRSLSLLRI
jgi:hypothetical protein